MKPRDTVGIRYPKVMGIINLSSNSFYKNSFSGSMLQALKMTEKFIEEGVDIIDIGAESSRPGSQPVAQKFEIEMLLPVVSEICRRFDVSISVDTYKPQVAEMVLEKGVDYINDITGLCVHEEMAGVIAKYKAGVIIMHMRGMPENMQDDTEYKDFFQEIYQFLNQGIHTAVYAGIDEDKIWVDPGIGFGKSVEQNLVMIKKLDHFLPLKKPILVGASRKSFIGHVLDLSEEDRLEGSLAVAVLATVKGASVLRVHDVKETIRAVKMAQAIIDQTEDQDS